jgi:hypothetical protein
MNNNSTDFIINNLCLKQVPLYDSGEEISCTLEKNHSGKCQGIHRGSQYRFDDRSLEKYRQTPICYNRTRTWYWENLSRYYKLPNGEIKQIAAFEAKAPDIEYDESKDKEYISARKDLERFLWCVGSLNFAIFVILLYISRTY